MARTSPAFPLDVNFDTQPFLIYTHTTYLSSYRPATKWGHDDDDDDRPTSVALKHSSVSGMLMSRSPQCQWPRIRVGGQVNGPSVEPTNDLRQQRELISFSASRSPSSSSRVLQVTTIPLQCYTMLYNANPCNCVHILLFFFSWPVATWWVDILFRFREQSV